MDEVFKDLMTNPWFSIGVTAAIFVIAVLLLFRRIISFVFTVFLFVVAVAAGFNLANNKQVQEYFGKEYVPGETFYERLMQSFECLKTHFMPQEAPKNNDQ